MSLIDEKMTECTLLVHAQQPDGQGGTNRAWTDAGTFRAAIVKDNTTQARIAEKQDVTELYTVTVAKGAGLGFHAVFRREQDGAIFRVTSHQTDSETPERASFQIGQVTAERWVLPE